MESTDPDPDPDPDPWDQEVPFLNASRRKYGSGDADRSWTGRTVKIRRIAARWFRFSVAKGLDD